ncbi:unnamed protein product [Camellia sinensis]
MSSKGEHLTVPLSVLLNRELANEKIERPEISHGQACQSKKGEDFTFVKTECQHVVAGDDVSTYSVFVKEGMKKVEGEQKWRVPPFGRKEGREGRGGCPFLSNPPKLIQPSGFLKIFDGHNGSAAAIYSEENLLNNVLAAIPSDLNRDEWVAALPRALVAGFVKTDKDFQEKGECGWISWAVMSCSRFLMPTQGL